MNNRYLGEEVLMPEQKEKTFVEKVKEGYDKLTKKKDTYTPEVKSNASFIETPASSLAVGAVVTGLSKTYFKQNWIVSASLGIAVAGAKYLLIDEKNAPLPNEKTKF